MLGRHEIKIPSQPKYECTTPASEMKNRSRCGPLSPRSLSLPQASRWHTWFPGGASLDTLLFPHQWGGNSCFPQTIAKFLSQKSSTFVSDIVWICSLLTFIIFIWKSMAMFLKGGGVDKINKCDSPIPQALNTNISRFLKKIAMMVFPLPLNDSFKI